MIDRQTDDAGGTGHDASPGPEESFWRIFTRRYIWITIGVGLAVNICWHFCRVWLPRYLDRDLGFNFKGDDTLYATFSLPWGHWAMTPADVGLLIQSGFYICADFGSLLAGYVTRKIIHAGWPVERARKAVQLGTALLCLLAIPAVALGKLGYPWVAVGLLFIVAAGAMGGFANYFSLTQEVSPRHTAQVLGFTGASAWFAVAALHPMAGRIADNIGTFVPLFQVIACVPLIGAGIGFLWPRRRTETV